MNLSHDEFITRLQTITGPAHVLHSPEDLTTYAYDGSPGSQVLPTAVVQPGSTEEVSAVLALAYENDVAIVPRGSGTGLSGGSIPSEESVVVQLSRMDRIIEIDEVNLTAHVEAGVITADLAAAAAQRGLFYPPDPGSMKISTVGGNVAENSGGLRCFKYGVTEDYLLGLEVVLPSGAVLTAGGKAKKDVAGYNLKKLFVSSEGTLGIVTKVLVRLIPQPSSITTLLAFFDSLARAGEAVTAMVAKGIVPTTLEFLDNVVINCVEDHSHLGLPRDKTALLLIQLDGHEGQVEQEAESVRKICLEYGAADVSRAKSMEEGERLAQARRMALSALARLSPTTILEDATVPRSELATMIEFIQATARKYNVRIGVFGHVGDGNLHPTFLTDERDREEMHRVHEASREIFQKAVELGGTITGEHGVGCTKREFLAGMVGPFSIDLMRKIKAVFDPKGLMNPGKIFDLNSAPTP